MSPRLLEDGGGGGETGHEKGEEGGSNLRNLHHLRSLSHFFTGYIKVKVKANISVEPLELSSSYWQLLKGVYI